MSLVMKVKGVLRRSGYDVVRYHSFWDTFVVPLGIKSILDIGANVGMFAKDVRERFPEADIYAFEPLPDCFAELKERMKGDPKFHAFNIALGSESGSTVMEQSSFHPSSSLRPMSKLHKELYPKSSGLTPVTIQIKRLDEVLSKISLAEPLLVKMDVQGYEDEVIKGGAEILKQASLLIVETSFVPLYEGQPLFYDIYRALSALGFSYRGRKETHYSRISGTPIYEDSVFVRT